MGGSAEGERRGVGRTGKRLVTLEDGRYLIYYTFGGGAGDEALPAGEGDASEKAEAEPSAEPEAAEERLV